MTKADQIINRGVYAFEHDDEIIYVGSSSCSLRKLDYNHRNAEALGYSPTHFRKQLATTYREKGSFKWLVEPFKCDQRAIETVEKNHINLHNTLCNIDKDPVGSSEYYGRY